jgi:hypothetical protein
MPCLGKTSAAFVKLLAFKLSFRPAPNFHLGTPGKFIEAILGFSQTNRTFFTNTVNVLQ